MTVGRRWLAVALVALAGSGACSTSDSGGAADEAVAGEPGPGELVDATEEYGLDAALAGIRGHAVAVADIDGDGWDDLFVGTFADREPETYGRGDEGPAPDRLLRGSADGFVVDGDFDPPLGRTAGALFADLDDDGDPDLIVSRNVREGDRADAPSEIYRNDDGTLVAATVLDPDRGGRAPVVVDVDGDGLLDIVLVEDRWAGASTGVFRNDGDLRFREVTAEIGFPDDVFGLGAAVGDLNGDGIDDLVIGGSNRWFLGDGDGFVEGAGSPLPWELHNNEDDPAHVVLLDADGDGRLDIVIGQHFNSTVDFGIPEPIRLYLNRGEGDEPSFEDATADAAMPAFDTKSPQVLAVDLDLDGTLELVATASSSGDGGTLSPIVLFERGDGGEVPSYEVGEQGSGPHYWVDAAVLDANHDGRPDLFFVEWEPTIGSSLFLNVPLDR